MLKTLKNQKGFTLVEVIVVAVIVLILAAVAIPLYNGYIKDSRQNVANNTAGSVASAFAAAIQADLDSTGGTDWTKAEGKATSDEDITIPGRTSGTENIIHIPEGYTIEWDGTEVWGYYTSDGDKNSTNYTYKVGGGN